MTIGIRSLKVDPNGKTMTLRLIFTPRFGSKKPDETVTLYDISESRGMRPTLLDRTNLKQYGVISGSSGTSFQTDLLSGARNGQSMEAWFVYAAPQDPISSLELSVLDTWAPFTNVPVQR